MKYKILREDIYDIVKNVATAFKTTPEALTKLIQNNHIMVNANTTQKQLTDMLRDNPNTRSTLDMWLKGNSLIDKYGTTIKNIFKPFSDIKARNEIQKLTSTSLTNSNNFSNWITGQIAKLYDEDDDLISSLFLKFGSQGKDALTALRKFTTENQVSIGRTVEGAGSTGLAAGLYKLWPSIRDFLFGQNEKTQEAANQAAQGNNTLLYGAAAAGVGAGLLWLYNKFKNNPRKQLTPQEIAYAMKLNQQTPNQGNNQ